MLKQRGDTIVEVALAFAVFALLAMGSIVLMNQGTATAQRALEQTQVRQVINGQADVLRLARQDSGLWSTIKANVAPSIPPTSSFVSGCPTSSTVPTKGFVMTRNAAGTALQYQALDGAHFAPAPVTSTVDYGASKAYGIWVQAIKINGNPAAYDLYIRACWDTVGTKIPATIATIVRLYDTTN